MLGGFAGQTWVSVYTTAFEQSRWRGGRYA
jgi:hypothetical protein